MTKLHCLSKHFKRPLEDDILNFENDNVIVFSEKLVVFELELGLYHQKSRFYNVAQL